MRSAGRASCSWVASQYPSQPCASALQAVPGQQLSPHQFKTLFYLFIVGSLEEEASFPISGIRVSSIPQGLRRVLAQ